MGAIKALVWILSLTVLYSARPGAAQCGAGWESYQSRCYWFSQNSMSREGAANDCRRMSSNLVTIDSANVQSFISQKNLNYQMWIGLFITEDPRNGTQWRWVDSASNVYQNWGTPVTNPIPCAQLLNSFGTWQNYVECSYNVRYVCKKAIQGNNCENNWSQYNNNCYFSAVNRVSNMDAQRDCLQRGGQLTSISSSQEEQFILSIISEAVWMGFYPIIWDDRTTYSYHNWDSVGPYMTKPCVYINNNLVSNLWTADDCGVTVRRYACSRGPFSEAELKESEKQKEIETTGCQTACPCAKSYLGETCEMDMHALCPKGYEKVALKYKSKKIPDPNDCGKFFMCMRGFPSGQCPSNTVFDPVKQRCTRERTCLGA